MTMFNYSEGRENDPGYRSWHIHSLCHCTSHLQQKTSIVSTIPRVVVQYWHDLSAIPPDVSICIASWEKLRVDGFKHRLFCDEQAIAFLKCHFSSTEVKAFARCHHAAMRCDFFRLCYLYQCGGAYVDADEVYGRNFDILWHSNRLKLQPLCYDLAAKAMVPASDFLAASASTTNRYYYVNNNPLIGPPGHRLIELAIERATRRLLESQEMLDIHETTGPGNLSASLVKHSSSHVVANVDWDFEIIPYWDNIAECRWHLSYRNDERNWRIAEQSRRKE